MEALEGVGKFFIKAFSVLFEYSKTSCKAATSFANGCLLSASLQRGEARANSYPLKSTATH
jgi:hypothetical protein